MDSKESHPHPQEEQAIPVDAMPKSDTVAIQQVYPKKRTFLNVLLGLILFGWLTIGGMVIVVSGMCSGQPTGCGDAFLMALPIWAWVTLFTVIYLIGVIIYSINDFIRKSPISMGHLIGFVIVVALGFIPQLGIFSFLTHIQPPPPKPSLISAQGKRLSGDTGDSIDGQSRGVTFSNMAEVRALIDDCDVQQVFYEKYDSQNPFTPSNTYIVFATYTHGRVNLAFSEKANVEAAVANKNRNLSGPKPQCKQEIGITPYEETDQF